MEKSNYKLKAMFIVAIIILILFAFYGGMQFGKSNSNNSNFNNSNSSISTSDSSNVEEPTSLTPSSDTIINLMNNKAVLLNRQQASTLFGVLYKSKGILAKDLSNEYKVSAGLLQLEDDSSTKDSTVSVEQFKKYMIEVFGSNVSYTDEDVKHPCGPHGYDATIKAYTVQDYGCGGTMLPGYSTSVISVKELDDSIEVTEKAILITPYLDGDKFYSKVTKPYSGEVIVDKIDGGQKVGVSNYLDKADTYIYTFKKDTDGHYYFYSIALQ